MTTRINLATIYVSDRLFRGLPLKSSHKTLIQIAIAVTAMSVALIWWISRSPGNPNPQTPATSRASEGRQLQLTERADRADRRSPSSDETLGNALVRVVGFDAESMFESLYSQPPDDWDHGRFTPIGEPQQLRATLEELRVSASSTAELSDRQRIKLLDSIEDLSLSLYQGNFERFAAFRLPASYTIDPAVSQWHRMILTTQFGQTDASLPQQPLELWKLYWQLRNTGSRSFQKLWTELQPPSVTVTTQPQQPGPLLDYYDFAGVSAYSPQRTALFDVIRDGELHADGDVTYADLQMVVKHRTGLAYPIVVRSAWDPDQETWLPLDLAVAYTGGDRVADPDF